MGRLNEADRKAVVAALVSGQSPTEISRAYRVSRQYVSKIKQDLRNQNPSHFDFTAAKERLRLKAYTGLESALDDPDDSYRRGRISLDTLKGTGDLIGDGNNINLSFAAVLTAIPADMRSELNLESAEDGESLVRLPDGREFVVTPEESS
jgi:hypothetical protein